MKLSVKELKAFRFNSAHIKSSNIIPICSYLKFENNTVTKHAMNTFCIQEIKCSESCLIDERILFSFLDGCQSDDITVKIDEKSITLVDKHRKIQSPTDKIENFPRQQFTDEGQVDLSNDVVWTVQEAAPFVLNGKESNHMDNVYAGKGAVAATNGTIYYIKEVKDEMPEMILTKEIITVAFRLDDLKFSENERYYFFQSGTVKYGFIKQEYSFWDMNQLKNVPAGMPKIEVEKGEIISFNDLCINTVNSMLQTVKMSPNKKNIDLVMESPQYEVYPSAMILANCQPFDTFKYLPRHMNTLLKSIPDSNLTIYKDVHKLIVTGASGFIAAINEVI